VIGASLRKYSKSGESVPMMSAESGRLGRAFQMGHAAAACAGVNGIYPRLGPSHFSASSSPTPLRLA